ncbi:protein-associating with the carboxyl-terminal domain of ezrin-like isoform X3 [Oscarella lobularis]|uniref:protein-associating with the carboxyl-terminal domain of ezrin-like isoform X3 n=1 Tax=Oscarella lobularis TaxID=121494 RepID=UPI0033141068
MGQDESRICGYSVGSAIVEQSDDVPWGLYPGVDVDDNVVSVFVHEIDDDTENRGIENGIRKLRSLRHPHLVKFLSASDDEYSGTIYAMVTSLVTPLGAELESMAAVEITNGLAGIAKALDFLHTECALTHNNVCQSVVYISEIGCLWQLAGMELACKEADVTQQFIKSIEPYRCKECIPPEDKEPISSSRGSDGHARDAYAFGMLVESLLERLTSLGRTKGKRKRVVGIDVGVGSVVDDCEVKLPATMLHSSPRNRPTFKTILNEPLLRGEISQIIAFLTNVTLKSRQEKETFFKSLRSKLKSIPNDVCCRLIVPLLLSRFVLTDPSASQDVIPSLLASDVGGVLPRALYENHVLPVVLKYLFIRETGVRLLLLDCLPHYVSCIDRELLAQDILPEILEGLNDCNEAVVSATFRALAHLVSILGVETVVGRTPERVFTETRPRDVRFIETSSLRADLPPPPPAECRRNGNRSDVGLPTMELASAGAARKERARRERERRRELRKSRNPLRLGQRERQIENVAEVQPSPTPSPPLTAVAAPPRSPSPPPEPSREQLDIMNDPRFKSLTEEEWEAWSTARDLQDEKGSDVTDYSDDDGGGGGGDVSSSAATSGRILSKVASAPVAQTKNDWSDFVWTEANGINEDDNETRKGPATTKTTTTKRFQDFFDEQAAEEARRLRDMASSEPDWFEDMRPAVDVKKKKSIAAKPKSPKRATTIHLGYTATLDEGENEGGDWGDDGWGDDGFS